ncbi:MAG TPA: HDOD domain-containing protein [Bryobacteraceae bacterium]|nr:HDOD domain-containing protein [Bryobacteraceae bacterium]
MPTQDLRIQLETLRPFPAAACKLIRLINDERVDFREVSGVIAADAAFSSQVLKLANSALLRGRYEITSILNALSVVGIDRLRDVVVTVALKNFLGDTDNAFLHRCWRHNLATALWCEKLAKCFDIESPLGYTAGILHDIGRIGLLMVLPNDYAEFLESAPPALGDPLVAERKHCKTDHCQVGHSLAAAWNFPAVLRDVIAHHHDAVARRPPRVRRLVQAACVAASMSGFYTTGRERSWESKRIEDLLPRPDTRVALPYEDLLETVARKLNETECSLVCC